ncbi:16S rRNA (guanine(527)-N(7))-methyltransferase RsmG [Undibacterium crateris]|uniref:16S rRNA (guanine(527)-N(7))-methyltransferase RsmG n=1 Tax=Undibacterium crateris TaxID=2528175 RepID=UPI00138A57B6|nr:16S rRNA (guanine(527)-N(7))-methyltransferase RsmG [Undibacterium crateris]NDI85227.1 16S rRNA (guanine(527)-N(7))-methyltransferase RsmG [Undibacterium crateris]
MAVLDTKALKATLSAGVQEMGLALSEAQIDQMLAYLALLSKWNAVYNLTAIRDPQEMVKQHLLDSLSAAPAFTEARNVLDVGAGGGLPGMMLAIAYPQTRISMIDTVSKKTAFLSQAKAELGLSNVTVFTGRVEQLEVTEKFDVITSRAFSELCNFINWSGHLLAEGGQFIAMKGVAPAQEIERLPAGWAVTGLQPLQVPGLNAERHLVFVRRIEPA